MYEGTRYAATLHSSGSVQRPDGYATTMDGKIKAPPAGGRMWLVGLEILGILPSQAAGAFARNTNNFNVTSAIHGVRRARSIHDRAGR